MVPTDAEPLLERQVLAPGPRLHRGHGPAVLVGQPLAWSSNSGRSPMMSGISTSPRVGVGAVRGAGDLDRGAQTGRRCSLRHE